MTGMLALALVGGAIILLLMALYVTIMARSMDAGRALSAKTSEQQLTDTVNAIAGAFPEGSSLQGLMRKHVLAKPSDVQATASAAKAKARKGGVAGAIVGAAITISVGAGVVSEVFDDSSDLPPKAMEFAAGELHGELLMPDRKNAPVVLIVPGSGPTDRDGDSPAGIKAAPYKLLAWGLADKGIGSLRIDKRGMFASAGAGDPHTVADYAGDIHEWIDAIRAQTGRKCVWLLGHSEGALMVSLAAEGREDVCGLILVAGPGRKLGDVIRSQLKANPANAPLVDQAFAAIADLEAGRHTDTTTMNPALLNLFAPEMQDFLISEMALDPVELLRRSSTHKLIVQGTNDLQVSVEDAKLLNGAPRTSLELIKGMNHVLKDAPQDREGNLATYADPDLPVPSKLVREIAKFVKGDDD